jgi:hypothetical protein
VTASMADLGLGLPGESAVSGARTVTSLGAEGLGKSSAAGSGARAIVDAGKYDYLFGRVASNAHNAPRSLQNAFQLARIGIYDNAGGRALLSQHFDDVVRTDSNIARTFSAKHGDFQVRDSILSGPGGFVRLESTWQVTRDGLRLTTVIPFGG